MYAYSTSTETTSSRNRVAIARVAAGSRITAERQAREKRREALRVEAAKWRAKLDKAAADAGAVQAGLKVCLKDGGKIRTGPDPVARAHDDAEFYDSLGEHDIEIYYLDADGEHIDPSVLSYR